MNNKTAAGVTWFMYAGAFKVEVLTVKEATGQMPSYGVKEDLKLRFTAPTSGTGRVSVQFSGLRPDGTWGDVGSPVDLGNVTFTGTTDVTVFTANNWPASIKSLLTSGNWYELRVKVIMGGESAASSTWMLYAGAFKVEVKTAKEAAFQNPLYGLNENLTLHFTAPTQGVGSVTVQVAGLRPGGIWGDIGNPITVRSVTFKSTGTNVTIFTANNWPSDVISQLKTNEWYELKVKVTMGGETAGSSTWFTYAGGFMVLVKTLKEANYLPSSYSGLEDLKLLFTKPTSGTGSVTVQVVGLRPDGSYGPIGANVTIKNVTFMANGTVVKVFSAGNWPSDIATKLTANEWYELRVTVKINNKIGGSSTWFMYAGAFKVSVTTLKEALRKEPAYGKSEDLILLFTEPTSGSGTVKVSIFGTKKNGLWGRIGSEITVPGVITFTGKTNVTVLKGGNWPSDLIANIIPNQYYQIVAVVTIGGTSASGTTFFFYKGAFSVSVKTSKEAKGVSPSYGRMDDLILLITEPSSGTGEVEVKVRGIKPDGTFGVIGSPVTIKNVSFNGSTYVTVFKGDNWPSDIVSALSTGATYELMVTIKIANESATGFTWFIFSGSFAVDVRTLKEIQMQPPSYSKSEDLIIRILQPSTGTGKVEVSVMGLRPDGSFGKIGSSVDLGNVTFTGATDVTVFKANNWPSDIASKLKANAFYTLRVIITIGKHQASSDTWFMYAGAFKVSVTTLKEARGLTPLYLASEDLTLRFTSPQPPAGKTMQVDITVQVEGVRFNGTFGPIGSPVTKKNVTFNYGVNDVVVFSGGNWPSDLTRQLAAGGLYALRVTVKIYPSMEEATGYTWFIYSGFFPVEVKTGKEAKGLLPEYASTENLTLYFTKPTAGVGNVSVQVMGFNPKTLMFSMIGSPVKLTNITFTGATEVLIFKANQWPSDILSSLQPLGWYQLMVNVTIGGATSTGYTGFTYITIKKAKLTVTTDKSEYTPNEVVIISGKFPSGIVNIAVKGPQNEVIWIDQVTAVGSFTSTFRLPKTVKEGVYTVYASVGSVQATATFTVVYQPLTVTTDKSIYAPNDLVNISGVLKNATTWEPVANVTVNIAIKDPNGKLVWIDQAITDTNGKFFSSVRLDPKAIPGEYTVYVTYGNIQATKTFMVV